jgi:hypothetical protein
MIVFKSEIEHPKFEITNNGRRLYKLQRDRIFFANGY